MKKSILSILLIISAAIGLAQPANDNCTSATTIQQNGTCITGTTASANDSWTNLVGCQATTGNHNDVWYTFVSTGTTANIVVTAGTMTGNVEVVLVDGSCAGGFVLDGSSCGASPLNATFNGLLVGTTYYFTVSNPPPASSNGTFTVCLTTSTPALSNAQNCNNAAIICNSSSYSAASSTAGYGTQEVSTANSCWGNGGERQSQWFKFTIGCSGVLNFAVNPTVSTDDYDWAIWDITGDPTGCTTKGNSIACNWSGCTGSTGLSSCPSSEPGVINCNKATSGFADPCPNGTNPRAFANWSGPGGTCLSSVLNVTAGNTYALLVDNFTTSNNGFTLKFGGACGGGTAHIGPDATFTTSGTACGGMIFTKTCTTANSTYLWEFGDGASSTALNPTHVYTTAGSYFASLTLTDALGCSDTYGVPVTVNIPIAGTSVGSATSICNGATTNIALTSTISGATYAWTVSQSGVSGASNGSGSTISQTLSLTGATAGTVTYSVIATASSCSSTAFVLTVTVNPIPSMTSGTSTSICSGNALNFPLTSNISSTYTWITTDNVNTTGESTTLQNTSTINNTLVNSTSIPQTLTYTVTPTSTIGTCTGSTQSVIVTLNPKPNMTSASSATICSSGTVSIPLISDVTSSYTWIATDNPNTTGESTTLQSTSTLLNTIVNNTTVTQTVTYTVTPTATVYGNCPGNPQTVNVTVNPTTTANAGSNATICSNATYTLSGSIGGLATSLNWTTSGTGTFNNALLANAIYTPSAADIAAGSVTLTITTNDPPGPCSFATATVILTINPVATANAGVNATICAGTSYSLSGSIGGGATSSTWSTSGTGSFDNSTLQNATYTPSAADITAGSVTLTITTNDPAGPCSSVNASMLLTINKAAIANAGLDASICQNSTYTLSGSIGGSATSSTWTTNGSGSFNNASLTNAVYTPSAADISAGSVTLTLTTNDPVGVCPAVSDNMVLTITPTDNATFSYSNSTYCKTGTNPTPTITGLAGGTFTFSPIGLSINGSTGTINLLSSTVGSYTVYYKTNGPCPSKDSMGITITTAPSANFSYSPNSFCQFVNTNPSPTFSIGASAGVFSATPAGLVFVNNITGTVNLISSSPGNYTITNTIAAANGCAQAIATNSLIIHAAVTANAGADAAICVGSTYALSGVIGGGATTLNWSTTGSGSFNNSTITNAIYTPSTADNVAGIVTLILHVIDPAGFCPAVDSMNLTIKPAATVSAGVSGVICAGSTFALSGTFGGAATSAQWSTSGTGTFNDATLTNAVYTPSAADISSGSVILTFTTNDPAGPCNAVSDAIVLTINPLAIVNAGADATICSSSHYTTAATVGGAASSITWSTSGTGSFANPNMPITNYTPSAADIAAGSVYLIATTNDPAGPCGAKKDTMLLTINPAATVNAGLDAVICKGSTFTLSGSFGGGASSSLWTTNGTGNFNNATLTNATYTPSVADIAAGTVTLTLTTDDPAGICSSVSDFMVLTINPPPTADAGADAVICTNSTYALSGSIGGGASSLTWGTTGTGSFNNISIATATYTPSASDITTGSVILFITTNDPPGPCGPVSDSMFLTINPPATANAGTSGVICAGSTYTLSGSVGGAASSLIWSTSGSGSFDNPTAGNAIYTPSLGDISSGSVVLTITSNDPVGPCPAVSDAIVLTINPLATANAGADAVICANGSYTLSGSIGGGATSATWTTSGTGTFNNPNNPISTYTPSVADIASGSVNLTITTNDPAGPCIAASDVMILTINPIAFANAGNDDVICAGNSYTLSGFLSGASTSGTWSSNGTGNFNNASLLNAVYTPSAADILLGNVTLTLTTNDPAGPCNAVSDAMVLTINPKATVNAGVDGSVCANAIYTLSGTYGGSATSVTWTTTGTGTFSNQTAINSTYTPSASDIASGSVYIVLTTNDPPGVCTAVTDTMLLTITPLQNAAFSYSSGTFCQSGTNPTPTITGVAGGTFSSTPAGLTINAITGTITLSTSSINTYTVTYTTPGPCVNSSNYTVTISTAPSATFSYNPTAYCQSAGTNPSPTFPIGASAGNFSATPSGLTFISANSGVVDLINSTPGIYSVTNTIAAAGGCATAIASGSITIGQSATATAGANASTCSNTSYTLSGAIGGSATSLIWITNGTGTFDNASLANATYTPSAADIAGGSVTLTINTDDPPGVCPAVSNSMQLSISPAATVNAGAAATICGGSTYTLSGVIGGGATSATWTTSGTGSFNNATLVNAVYTPSAADITAGSVTLTLTTNDPAGPCPAVSSTMILTINPPATANAGLDATICSENTYTLSGSIGGAATSLTWTTSGTGTFNNASLANAIYTPSAADITAGSVTLTITTNDPAGVCTPVSDNMVLTINLFHLAAFNYPGSTFCQTGSDPTPTILGPIGGFFTSSPAGLTISPSSGTISLGSSAAGTYTISNHTAGPCPDSATATVTITTSFNANFGYVGSLFCQAGSPNPLPTYIGTGSGGIFTVAPAGLVINTITGAVDLATSAAGSYIVTNTIAAAGGCAVAVDTGAITITAHDNAGFNYSGSSFCNSGVNETPTITGLAGGTFTASPANLVINSATGVVSVSASTVGTYSITYTTNGICPFFTTVPFTITPAPDASFQYASGGVFCKNALPNPTPIIPGAGGIFSSSPAFMVINAATGQITLAASTPGTYIVRDSIPAANGCAAAVVTHPVTINALDNAGFNYAQSTYCNAGNNPVPTITGVSGGSFTASPTGLTINASTGAITLATSTLNSYTITYTTNGACPNSSTKVINIVNSPVANAGPDESLSCTGTATLAGVAVPNTTYNWTTTNGNIVSGANTLTPTISQFGIYTLTVTDNTSGCSTSDTTSVFSTSHVTASFTTTPNPATGIAPLDVSFVNTSTNATSYVWDFCNGCPVSNTFDANYIYNTSGTYTAILTAINGTCRDSTSIKVIVEDAYSMILTNVFTPNDDGINDIFNFKVMGVATLDAVVYDRWGLKMYEWVTVNGGWDGHTLTGLKAPEGTYFYIVTLTDYSGIEHVEKGSFMLLR